MVMSMLSLTKAPPEDASDALALAICHLHNWSGHRGTHAQAHMRLFVTWLGRMRVSRQNGAAFRDWKQGIAIQCVRCGIQRFAQDILLLIPPKSRRCRQFYYTSWRDLLMHTGNESERDDR